MAREVEAEIYIVGQDVVQVALIRASLEASGLSVSAADNGFEAIDRIRLDPRPLLVLDANLSQPNAVELLRRLPSDRGRRMKILGIMKPGEPGLEDRLRDGGVDAFVTEPFEPERLVAAARRLLEME